MRHSASYRAYGWRERAVATGDFLASYRVFVSLVGANAIAMAAVAAGLLASGSRDASATAGLLCIAALSLLFIRRK